MRHPLGFAFAAGLLLLAPAVAAQQPSPSNSSAPPVLWLMGERAGVTDPLGTYSVVVRDAANVPIVGAEVKIHFSEHDQLVLATVQSFSGMTALPCAEPPEFTAFTDGSGLARFAISGGVAHRAATEPSFPSAGVDARNGGPWVPLGDVVVAAFDQDGVNGVRAHDLALFNCDYINDLLNYHQRSDYDGDGASNVLFDALGDLDRWRAAFFGSGSEETGARCDAGPTTTGLTRVEGDHLVLRWSECAAEGGTQSRTFACNTNSGSDTLVGFLRAPAGVDAMSGLEVALDVISAPGSPLPEWWRIQAGGCRTALTQLQETGSASCPDFVGSSGLPVFPQVDYPHPNGLPNYAQIRLVKPGSVSGTPLVAGQLYEIFRLGIGRAKTTGAGACAGCGAPVAIVLRSVRITQPPISGGGCGEPAVASAPRDAAIRADRMASLTGDYLVVSRFSSDNVSHWNGSLTDVSSPSGSRTWLGGAMPNPMQYQTVIPFSLARPGVARLVLYDVAGRRVRELKHESLDAGPHQAIWDGRDDGGIPVPSGIYFARLDAGTGTVERTVIAKR